MVEGSLVCGDGIPLLHDDGSLVLVLAVSFLLEGLMDAVEVLLYAVEASAYKGERSSHLIITVDEPLVSLL